MPAGGFLRNGGHGKVHRWHSGLNLDEGVPQINVCDAHEIVGRSHLFRQHSVLDLSCIAACLMLAYGSPSVSAALKEITATCNEHLECTLIRAVHESDIGMAVRVDDNSKVKYPFHMRGTSNRRIDRQFGLEDLNVFAIGVLSKSTSDRAPAMFRISNILRPAHISDRERLVLNPEITAILSLKKTTAGSSTAVAQSWIGGRKVCRSVAPESSRARQ